MKALRLVRILFVVFLLFFGGAQAKGLEWQKIELERTIKSQYQEIISPLLKRNEYYLQVVVKYSDPGMPNFDDLNSDAFKVSDVKFDDSKGDYIAFSKVGLEVPVLGKAFKENQRKLKEAYRYNEAYDLFKNFQSIDVILNISDAVSNAKVDIIRNIVESYKLSFSNFVPKISVKKIKMSQLEDKSKVQSTFDIFDFIGKFGNAIGMIITVILLGLVAYKLLKMWMDFMENLKSLENQKDESNSQEEAKDGDSEEEESTLDQKVPEEQVDQIEGFERFEKLLELNPRQSILLAKKWIKQGDDDSRLALNAIAQQLDTDKLDILFDGLSAQERETWNSSIQGFLEGDKLIEANLIISEGVIKELVGGSAISDFELVDIVLSMNVDMVKGYIVKNKEYGSFLCNLINPSLISDLLNDLEVDEMNEIITNSLSLDMKKLDSEMDKFKRDLSDFCNEAKIKPFNYKLLQVVSGISAEKEAMLYRFIAKNTSRSEIISAASRNIPSELIYDLPTSSLKIIMQNYPMEKKVNLLSCIDEDKQQHLLNSFTVEGSNAREMIDMELEAIRENELQFKRVQLNKENIWSEFVSYVRVVIKNDETIGAEAVHVIEEWVRSLKEDSSLAS